MIAYRCYICGTYYSKDEIRGSMLSPCCKAAMTPIYMPEEKKKTE